MNKNRRGSETDETSDEVSDIKNAMRLCHMRQKSFKNTIASQKNRVDNNDGDQDQAHSQTSITLLKKQHCELVLKLEKRCLALEDELNYTKKVLKTKEKNLLEESHVVDLKVQAIDAEYKQSYGDMKKTLTRNSKSIKSVVLNLFYLLSMLERNTLHGRHLTLSETNVGLLLKLRSGLECIQNACDAPSSAPTSASANCEVDECTREDSGHCLPVDSTLLEICKHLEDENRELKSQIELNQTELQSYKHKASKTSLIPHYRTAIVKSREECTELRITLERSQEQCRLLQVQLESMAMEAKKLEASKVQLEMIQFQLIEECDKYKAVIFDVIEDKQPGLYRTQSAYKGSRDEAESLGFSKKRRGTSAGICRQESPSSSPHEASNTLEGRESLMQEHIDVLDCEIDDLRQRLELAAVARTQSVMAGVNQCDQYC